MAAAIAVHRVVLDAGGHELRHADGAGIGAAGFEIELAGHGERQEVGQLAAEHGGALGLGRVRIVEGQRGQRVQHAEIAHVAAIQRFNADDRGDDRGRDAEALRGLVELVAMLVVELHAPADALGLDEARAVGQPAAPDLLARGRRRDQARHRGVVARAFEGGDHRLERQVALGGQAFDEAAHLGAQDAAGGEGGRAIVRQFGTGGRRRGSDADGGGVAGGGRGGQGGGRIRGGGSGGGTAGQEGRQGAELQ
ncbi:Uncharacterised protein [Achromobacter sp. 2789STDY5608621]|nr:Uncharacterised protein [Achromobacter sp. 2789STDY5608621]